MLADVERLRDADGREIHEQSEVARDAAPSRVRDTVTVVEDEVGRALQSLERREHSGGLAEREQARDVGKPRRLADEHALDRREPGKGEHDDRRPGHPARVLEADVDPRDARHWPDPILAQDAAAQPRLQRHRFLRREIPAVAGAHRACGGNAPSVNPESITSTWPVMVSASPTNQSTAAATSSGMPTRASGAFCCQNFACAS